MKRAQANTELPEGPSARWETETQQVREMGKWSHRVAFLQGPHSRSPRAGQPTIRRVVCSGTEPTDTDSRHATRVGRLFVF